MRPQRKGNNLIYLRSTDSKSRINFPTMLQAVKPRDCCNAEARAYWHEQGLPQAKREALMASPLREQTASKAWGEHLGALGITILGNGNAKMTV